MPNQHCKKDGYHVSHVLFVLVLLPLLRIKTVKGFCEKHWEQWSKSKKDTFYRFKQNASYRWRSFMYKVNVHIFKTLELDKTPQEERYFVIDDTILLADDSAVITYAHRLWDFFQGLFRVSFSKIFHLTLNT